MAIDKIFPNPLGNHNNRRLTESERANEHVAELREFVAKYVKLNDGEKDVIDWPRIEQDFGLEPGFIKKLWDDSEGKASKDNTFIAALLTGLWAGEQRWQHIETAPMVVPD